MRVYKDEFERLREAKSFVKTRFRHFGVNKKQEITRLLYEISKRDKFPLSAIIKKTVCQDYNFLKNDLLRIRYPYSFSRKEVIRAYLPKVELKKNVCFKGKEKKFYPEDIFIEQKARGTYLAGQVKRKFPKARFHEIESLKKYRCLRRGLSLKDYNCRQDAIFIVNETYDFFKKCPCTKAALGCGYQIFNLGFGCIFECSYCFLQEYTNSPGIILPANIEVFFDKFNSYRQSEARVGTGEFSDSLALDEVSGYSFPIINFFRDKKNVIFEFKTKSTKIENLLKASHSGNIVVSWSLNPQPIIDENEFFTPSLAERIAAAAKCVEAGYRVGFHFDPLIYFPGWVKEYQAVIERLFNRIKPEKVAWISLGTFRFRPALKPVIEKRFPGNKILDQELLLGYDDKLRYPYSLRYSIYKEILKIFFKHSRKLKLYLCMEELSLWKDLGLNPGFALNFK